MKAFSLVEILVVLAVISILLVVCIPLYRHAADFQMDVMPEALRYTHAMQRHGGYAVMMVRKDQLGTFAICMKAGGIPLIASIDLDTKRIQVPEYEPAVVIYDSRGRLQTGMVILIDGSSYTSTNKLILDGKTRWLHKSMGEIL